MQFLVVFVTVLCSSCRVHATSVLHVMHLLMHHNGLIQAGILPDLMVLACYLSGAHAQPLALNTAAYLMLRDPIQLSHENWWDLETCLQIL